MARTVLGGRVTLDRRSLGLVVGDLVLLAAVVAAGEVRHGGGVADFAGTALEFGVAWLVVAVIVGAYGPRALTSGRRAGAVAAAAWVPAAILGAGVRAAVEPVARFDPIFVIVMIVAGSIALLPWRGLIAVKLLGPPDGSTVEGEPPLPRD